MKPTTETDLLGGETKKAKKAAKKAAKKEAKGTAKASKKGKGKKAEAADNEGAEAPAEAKGPSKKELKAQAKAEKKAQREAEKAAKKEAKKAEKKKDEREPVDQTPRELTPIHSFKPATVDLLVELHASEKPMGASDLAEALKTDTKGVANRAKPLIDAGLISKDDKLKEYDVVGQRHAGLKNLLDYLRLQASTGDPMPTSARIGKALWADPKKAQKLDTVRFGRAAGRLLEAAFQLGVVRRFIQPRRKYSDTKVRKLYTADKA
jgi:predicted transcriptional regulator